jgi:shikimate 5-dehydrogenase
MKLAAELELAGVSVTVPYKEAILPSWPMNRIW